MKYHVATFITSPELHHNKKGNSYWRETNWWKKDSTHATLERAYLARGKVLHAIDLAHGYNPRLKVAVWNEQAWRELAEGYKHPRDRDHKKLHPKNAKDLPSRFKLDNDIETSMAVALHAAGL